MANSSYLTPDWLMSDINALLQRRTEGVEKYGAGEGGPLSMEDFKSEYFDESTNPIFGKRDKLWYKDWSSDIEGYTGGMGERGYSRGYGKHRDDPYYYEHQDAYDKYLKAWQEVDRDAFGQVSANPFDRESFIGGIEQARGIPEGGGGPASAFTALTPEMLKKLRTEHYNPMLTEGRGSLIDELVRKRESVASMGGGIAGYGRRRGAFEDLGTQYRSGVEDIYANIESQKAESLQSIYDVLGQYKEIT